MLKIICKKLVVVCAAWIGCCHLRNRGAKNAQSGAAGFGSAIRRLCVGGRHLCHFRRHRFQPILQSMVGSAVNYDRYKIPEQLSLLQSIYADLHIYVNFFQPILKSVGKKLAERKFIKVYDRAATPFQRALQFKEILVPTIAALNNAYFQTNPVVLKNKIDDNVVCLWHLSQ